MNTEVQSLGMPSLGRVWSVSWRIMVVGFGAWFSAELISDAIKAGGNTRINIATTGVAAGTLLAFFADFVALYQGCVRYARGMSDSLADLSKALWKAWVSLTLIFLSYFAWGSSSNPDPLVIVYSNQGSPGTVSERRISTVPALFKRDATVDWKQGVAFDEEELDISVSAFSRILSAYVACGSASGTRPVKMTIAGYASSHLFDHATPEVSNQLNVETANRRAWNAYCFTARTAPVDMMNRNEWAGPMWSCPNAMPVPAGTAAPIQVHVTHWADAPSGFEKMMGARPIQDWPREISETQRRFSEELDRRVDFYLNDAGACQIERPLSSPATIAANTH